MFKVRKLAMYALLFLAMGGHSRAADDECTGYSEFGCIPSSETSTSDQTAPSFTASATAPANSKQTLNIDYAKALSVHSDSDTAKTLKSLHSQLRKLQKEHRAKLETKKKLMAQLASGGCTTAAQSDGTTKTPAPLSLEPLDRCPRGMKCETVPAASVGGGQ